MKKKHYIKPLIEKIVLDNTISLQMVSGDAPVIPGPRTDVKKGTSDPFASPFGEKPFN